jgi:signal transduction histidine kinase/DNA-binding response OmpR family regulator
MKLWVKTVLIIGVSLVVLIALLSLLLSSIMLERFTAYEQEETQQNAARAADTFWNKAMAIDQYANSWAFWDDMYEYSASKDPAFIESQVEAELKPGAEGLSPDLKTMQTLLFIDSAGQIAWGIYYDREQQRIVEPPDVLKAQLTPDNPLLQHPNIARGNIGIMVLPNEELLVAARPIITSQGDGPARGTVLAGRFIDEHLAADIERTIRMPVSLHRIGGPNMPSDVQQAEEYLLEQAEGSRSGPNNILATPLDKETIAGYALLSDMLVPPAPVPERGEEMQTLPPERLDSEHGNPAVILRIEEPRTIYQHGRTGVVYLTSALLIVGLIAGVGMSGLLDALVVRRLARLDERVQQIRSTNDLTGRVVVSGRDEITSLAHSINGMLTSLEALVSEQAAAQSAAEEANALKTRFIANMSHELRTPLNSIINFTYIIKSGMRGPVTEDQVEYLNRVYASGEHLLGMINDILDLAKIEAGRMDLFKEPLALDELVRSTLASAVGLTKDKLIDIRHEIAEGLPAIEADKTRIRQVLLNLLSNAAKFTDTGSITVQVWQEGHKLIISVNDTGTGIPADKFDAIFEEFRQADEGSDRSYQGTGLGLPICKRLVEMHGGRIWLESTVGEGSTFFFSLPIVESTIAGPGATTAIPADDHAGPLVLVIDDDPAAIEIVKTYLQQADYAVVGVTDSRTAIDEVRRWQPAVIILDILMPYKDGWEVLAALKDNPDLRTIPVLCYTIVEEKPLALSMGADAYLVKPIEEGVLQRTVNQLVDHTARILVVDTDPTVIHMITHYLGENGYQVLTASDGQTALEAISTHRPDLVILDLVLPEVDGFTLLKHLEQETSLRTIPVIVLQETEISDSERTYLHDRVLHLVRKEELTPQQMLRQVQQVLQQQT